MISVFAFTFSIALAATLVMLTKSGVQLYRNRRYSTPLPEDWGAAVCLYFGVASFALYHVLPNLYLGQYHPLLAFVGVNLMLAAGISRFRYLREYRKKPAKPTAPRPNAPQRVANR